MDVPTLRILWGPGGHATLTVFGHDDVSAKTLDITGIAAFLAARGLVSPRTVCPPRDVNGAVEVDFGVGGRAQWIEGGGDVSADEVMWALAAALENGGAELVDRAYADRDEREGKRLTAVIEELLIAAGATSAAAHRFVERPRKLLDDQSIASVWSSPAAGPELPSKAAAIAVDQLDRLLRSGGEAERSQRRAHLDDLVRLRLPERRR